MAYETFVKVTEGKTPRNAQPLPHLTFVAMDDWVVKLGEKSFCLWLKLFTMVDRTDRENEQNHSIKTRQSKLLKKLGMSKTTYLRLTKPLFEYGLIDFVDYEDSNNKGSKPVNVVVYRFPQNKSSLAMEPLKRCRTWEQRIDEKYSFSYKGGRPKKETPVEVPDDILPEKEGAAPAEEVGTKEEVTFNTNVNPVITSEFNHFKEGMEDNNVDLGVVIKWVNKNESNLPYPSICYVFKQLATFPEEIKKTSSFITSTLNQVPPFYRPVTEPRLVKEGTEYKRIVPFYNWLEDDK